MVPVAVGTSIAYRDHALSVPRASLALAVALSMQVGVNYANDYSDGVRGTDDHRVGPARLVGGGLAAPASVKRAALASFGVGAVAGTALAVMAAPWLIAVGAVCIAAGWLYTGGPRPYGYSGFGEVAVFVFFGVIATVGTSFVQEGRVPWPSAVASVGVGALAVALLVVNNLRDREGDEASGKRTLAVKWGDRRTRRLYVGCVVAPFVVAGLLASLSATWVLLSLASAPLAAMAIRRVLGGTRGPELVAVLGTTSKLQAASGALMSIGFVLSRTGIRPH